eukprot:600123-Pyramimonas_sp.AAC.1
MPPSVDKWASSCFAVFQELALQLTIPNLLAVAGRISWPWLRAGRGGPCAHAGRQARNCPFAYRRVARS